MKIDMHVHSKYSRDSNMSLSEIAYAAQMKGLDAVVITDHDSLEALRHIRNNNIFHGIRIFVGCEISSMQGHILAYGITELVAPTNAEDVIDSIHEQGGIAIAAHPYRKNGLGVGDLIFDLPFDGIEVMSTTVNKERSYMAIKTAKLLGLPQLAGSDAHILRKVGLFFTEFPNNIESIDDIIKAIKCNLVKPRKNQKK